MSKNKKKVEIDEVEIDPVESENLLVYKLQGGNEVNQVKKKRNKNVKIESKKNLIGVIDFFLNIIIIINLKKLIVKRA